MRVIMLSTPDYAPAEISSKVAADYCRRRNYSLEWHRSLIDADLHPSWNKLLLLERTMRFSSEGEWILWHDADVLIVDAGRPLESLVSERFELVFSEDGGGLCMGFVLFRNSKRTRDLLGRLWNRYRESWPWEQDAMKYEVARSSSLQKVVRYLPQSVVQNPQSEFSQTAFAMHYWAHYHGCEEAAKWMKATVKSGWTPGNFPRLGT